MTAPAPRIEVEIASINIGDRIRKDFSHVEDLAESIRDDGLIQPIVVDANHNLIAGESRLRACRDILQWKTIPVVYFELVDEAQRVRLEATENIQRKSFTWQEHCLAVDKVHRFESHQAALKSERWTMQETGRLLGFKSKVTIWYCTETAKALRANDPEILKCDSMSDAIRVLLKRKEDEANKLLVKLTMPAPGQVPDLLKLDPATGKPPVQSVDDFYSEVEAVAAKTEAAFTPGVSGPDTVDEMPGQQAKTEPVSVPLSQMLHLDNCIQWMLRRPGVTDHIITDIPYAIDMDNLQQSGTGMDVSSTASEHDVDSNMILMREFFPAAYHAMKDNGFLITWCDQSQWQFMVDLALDAGFKVQRWPLVWHKTSPCLNQSAQFNYTKNFEIAMVCRKGNATLVRPQPSAVFSGPNDAKDLGHPFAKPANLWTWLFDAVTIKGQTVLDPFAGVGSSTLAAIRYGLKPLSVELKEEHFNRAVVNVSNLYLSLNPNARFS